MNFLYCSIEKTVVFDGPRTCERHPKRDTTPMFWVIHPPLATPEVDPQAAMDTPSTKRAYAATLAASLGLANQEVGPRSVDVLDAQVAYEKRGN